MNTNTETKECELECIYFAPAGKSIFYVYWETTLNKMKISVSTGIEIRNKMRERNRYQEPFFRGQFKSSVTQSQ